MMSSEQIHLEKITWDNYRDICRLRVTKEQDSFVARNERSLIHAYIALSQGEIKPFPFARIAFSAAGALPEELLD